MTSLKVKDWAHFQHFKDRRPPWIKLYRDLLDDPDWHDLDGESAKNLVMLWLLASEDKTTQGTLPKSVKKIAFRLRITEAKAKQILNKLSDWLIHDDAMMISERYQDDAPETETETETEVDHFVKWWQIYPKKIGKGSARKAFAVAITKTTVEQLTSSVVACTKTEQWTKDKGKFIPHPTTWLNQERWDDEMEMSKEVVYK